METWRSLGPLNFSSLSGGEGSREVLQRGVEFLGSTEIPGIWERMTQKVSGNGKPLVVIRFFDQAVLPSLVGTGVLVQEDLSFKKLEWGTSAKWPAKMETWPSLA